MAVWTLVLQPEPEGPSLISCVARCSKSVLLRHQNLLFAPSWRTVVGEAWKPFERQVENPGQTVDRKAAELQMAALG
ncbi:hypothetical protein [Hoeflea sp.]|uniref:hypothetical protein n=1 Tax=Hoeflea sp. TaxID=1940281 RepID=UPI003B02B38A